MNTYNFYDPATGLFTGRSYSGPYDLLELNTPLGMGVWVGTIDCKRVKVEDGCLVPYEPPPLPDIYVASAARGHRDVLLRQCDWLASRSQFQGVPIPPEWITYTQALRDVPDQPGFPHSIIWPEKP